MPAKAPPNVYRVEGPIAYIGMRGGYEAMIDAEDLGKVMPFNWSAIVRDSFRSGRGTYGHRAVYAARTGYRDQALHRFILNAPPGKHVDHINGDGLDNRKANLRLTNNSENMQNRRAANRNSKTGARGVSRYYNPKIGLELWALRIWLPAGHPSGKKSIMKYFPYTDEGYRQAVEAAPRLRAELMSHAEG